MLYEVTGKADFGFNDNYEDTSDEELKKEGYRVSSITES